MIHPTIHSKFIPAIKKKYQNNTKASNKVKRPSTFDFLLISLGQYDLLKQILERVSKSTELNSGGE